MTIRLPYPLVEPWCAETSTVPGAAATTVSPRSALAVEPRLKSISQDTCALLALLFPAQVWPHGKGIWKAGAAWAGAAIRRVVAAPMTSAAAARIARSRMRAVLSVEG
jgi:hypothetical protein